MRFSVSPGQVDNWLFLIDRINVEGVGIKHAAWRNWANYCFVLLICTMKLSECAYGWVSESGMSHKPSNMLCLPFRMTFLFSSNTWRNFLLKWLDIHHHIYDQLILSMNFVMLKRPGFLLQQVGLLRVSDRIAVFPLCYYQVFQLRDPFVLVELILMHGHHLGWRSVLFLGCLPSWWFLVVGLQQFCLSAEEYLLYDMYLASLSL